LPNSTSGKAWEKTLLVAAMEKFLEIFNTAGGTAFLWHAKDQEAKRYYERFRFCCSA